MINIFDLHMEWCSRARAICIVHFKAGLSLSQLHVVDVFYKLNCQLLKTKNSKTKYDLPLNVLRMWKCPESTGSIVTLSLIFSAL